MEKTLKIIKESFEKWYQEFWKVPVTIVINYSDVQNLRLKAIHTATVEVSSVFIQENQSITQGLFKLTRNYNHGETTASEVQEELLRELLIDIYSYGRV